MGTHEDTKNGQNEVSVTLQSLRLDSNRLFSFGYRSSKLRGRQACGIKQINDVMPADLSDVDGFYVGLLRKFL